MDLRAAGAPGTDAPAEAVARLAADADLLAFHRDSLPACGRRLAGDFRPERLIALAKIEDAGTLDEAVRLLSAKEKAAALADDDALAGLVALRPQKPAPSSPRQ
jgi:membrane glycosyltransferase